jgi:hypothetical protein
VYSWSVAVVLVGIVDVKPHGEYLQPAHGCPEQADCLLLLRIEAQDFHYRRTRRPVLCHLAAPLGLSDGINDVALLAVLVLSRVDGSFFDIVEDVKCVARSFRNGESIVEGEPSWNASKRNDDPPHLIDSQGALAATFGD